MQGLARFLALAVAVSFSAAAAPPPPPEQSAEVDCADCEHGCAHAKTMRARFLSGESPDGTVMIASAPDPTYLDTDLLHYDLSIEIDPTARTISGSNTLRFKSLVNDLLVVRVRLQDNFSVPSITVDGAAAGQSRFDDRTVYVFLPRAYNAGEEFDVRVMYSGSPQNNGFDSINFTTQSGTPIAATLSETDFAYTWWPTKDDNRDKATADLRFTVPASMSVASNGSLMSVTDAAPGKKMWHWNTAYPTATYLFSFSVTNYTRFSGSYNWGGGVMPLEFFIYPNSDTTSNRNAWLQTVQMLATFRPVFGLYPFINEKYGIYQFPFGGGMEHQTMTGQGTFSESVTAHELGHQWWGDMVTCASWNDIWLNEGFATYAEALWLERKPGSTGAPALHSAMAARRPSSVNGSVYIPEPLNTSDIGRIFSTSFSYRKPAWVLHMLRRVVGDEQFFAILAAYRQTFEYGSATTEDFRAVAESVSGRNLSQFFSQWIYGSGAPAYQRAWRNTTINGRVYTELMIRQVQSGQVFHMPIDIVTTLGAVPTTRTVQNDASTEWYILPTGAAPSNLQVDPTPWVLATSNTSTTFIEGPPKVVEISPAPGSSSEPDAVASIGVWFHKGVTTAAGDYSLVGASVGPVALSFAYDGAARKTTLAPLSALGPDAYTLTIADSVRDPLSFRFLDGEIADPISPASLPSGEGQPGGAAVIRFTVSPPPPCLGDADGDGNIDFADVIDVLKAFGVVYGAGLTGPGDADRNGVVDFLDITKVLETFGLVCA